MSRKSLSSDYEPVVRSRPAPWWEGEEDVDDDARWPARAHDPPASSGESAPASTASSTQQPAATPPPPLSPVRESGAARRVLKRGHALSYLGLFLFTFVVYFRPYELFPALSSLTSMAYWLAVATCLAFIPSQLSVEGTLTVRPREVNLALLLCLAGLLSVPLALEPAEAWTKFVDYVKVIFMFIVMVNVVRTERRLKWMILLALAVSYILSAKAINDYLTGNLVLKGERIAGMISNLFDNPNDLALHLVTMVPIAVGLCFMSRGLHRKIFYGAGALLMTLATIFTFSRGGFLALIVAALVLAWKLGRRSRLTVAAVVLFLTIALTALAPGNYMGRMASIFDNDLDTSGSATSRQNLLVRSLLVSARHPLLGVGMGNFYILSIHDQVSHNAYTQVSAEMGVAAMVVYILFILASLKRMREIERETYDERRKYRTYYLAVGLQASLLSYMVSSFFASVAYQWYIYYLVGYALCLYRLHEARGGASAQAAAPTAAAHETTENAKAEGHAAAFQLPPAATPKRRRRLEWGE